VFGYIEGEIIFSDGEQLIVKLENGLGMQVHYGRILPVGSNIKLFLTHVVREDSQTLYAFSEFSEKKLFELLLTVSGVGPRTAYLLIKELGQEKIIQAVLYEDKKLLCSVSGIGPKTASQILLDLGPKMPKTFQSLQLKKTIASVKPDIANVQSVNLAMDSSVYNEAILAFRELGFKDDQFIPIIQKHISANGITKPEQLVQRVLKEL